MRVAKYVNNFYNNYVFSTIQNNSKCFHETPHWSTNITTILYNVLVNDVASQ
jgi:hypothetical protein